MSKNAAPVLPEPPGYLTGALAERFREVAVSCRMPDNAAPDETAALIAKYVLAGNEYLSVTKRLQDALAGNDADAAAKWLTMQKNLVSQQATLAARLGLSPERRSVGGDESELTRQALRERNRLVKLLKQTSAERAQTLKPVCENVGWMKARLDAARTEIGDAPLTVEYQNGDKQSGITENPALRVYESLFRSYIAGLAKILDALPPSAADAAINKAPVQTQLALIKARREKAG